MFKERNLLIILMALGAIAVLTSVWLLSIHINLSAGISTLGANCGFGASEMGCEVLAVSEYSKFLSIPIAAIGLGYYVCVTILFFWAFASPQARLEPLFISFNLATIAIVVTSIMAFIARMLVGQFCPGCTILWAVNLLVWPILVKLLGLNWGNALAANLETFRPKRFQLNAARLKSCFTLAIVCVLVSSIATLVIESDRSLEINSKSARADIIRRYNSAKVLNLNSRSFGEQEGINKRLQQSKGGWIGNVQVSIIKFADFQCPACKVAAQYFKPFYLKNKSIIRFVYQHFPLDGSCNPYVPNGSHAFACYAAKYSYCAPKFSETLSFHHIHDRIFDKQNELSKQFFENLTHELKIDSAKLATCMEAESTGKEIYKQIYVGEQIGIRSTPTFIVNNHLLSGVISPAQWETLLEHILKQSELDQKRKAAVKK